MKLLSVAFCNINSLAGVWRIDFTESNSTAWDSVRVVKTAISVCPAENECGEVTSRS